MESWRRNADATRGSEPRSSSTQTNNHGQSALSTLYTTLKQKFANDRQDDDDDDDDDDDVAHLTSDDLELEEDAIG